MSKGEDIFISYRRAGGAELAQLIFQHLSAEGYHVFLDVRSLDSGPFDEGLRTAVKLATDFIVILSPGCFGRCGTNDDWFRQVIALDLSELNNVAPVSDTGLTPHPLFRLVG